MTRAEHDQQRAWVRASEMRCPTRAQAHGVYAKRRPVVAAPRIHRFEMPVVREKL